LTDKYHKEKEGMNSLTVFIYPSARDNSLLSLTDFRSKFMMPVGGKFRIADFALRNALTADPYQIVMYSDVFDDLHPYLETHPINQKTKCKIIPIVDDSLDVKELAKTVKKHETSHYLIYCGDNPALIDFGAMYDYYIKKKKNQTVLFQLKNSEKASMANTALMTTKKNFISVLTEAIKQKRNSPHLLEMINNMLINKGVEKSTHHADIWPVRNIPDFYSLNYNLLSGDLFKTIYTDPILTGGIKTDQPAKIGPNANISSSFISEGCIIDGKVTGSIIFPGVIITEKAEVKDSIILPYVTIAKNAKIENAVIDEFTDYANSPFVFNIGEYARIGSDADGLRNSDYPKSLFSSISLIGKNCLIPTNSNIGSACFIASATGFSFFEKTKTLEDGLSIVPYPEIYS